jgi:CDP-glucose 4,6-dehydratase
VLEPLSGYLVLAQRLFEGGPRYGEAWNFGPEEGGAKTVEWVVQRLCARWGEGATYRVEGGDHPHEASCLKLDCSKAQARLGWRPRWSLERALEAIVEWTLAYRDGRDTAEVCLRQIEEYMG